MTLSETLITIFIATIILGALIGIYFTYTNVLKVQVAYSTLSSTSTITMDKITSSIRGASKVVDNYVIDSTNYNTDYDTIILKIPSIDGSQVIIENTFDYLVYYLDASNQTQLKSNIEPDPNSSRTSGEKHVGEFIDALVFNYNNTTFSNVNKVEVILSVQKSEGKSVQEIIVQNTIHLRNY